MKSIFLHFVILFQASITPTLVAQGSQHDINQLLINKMEISKSGWNQGDFKKFMSPYWESDSLIYMGKDKVTKGYLATLLRYETNYPDAESRGKLEFEYHSIEILDSDHVIMLARYTLTRTNDMVSGNFLLVWKRIRNDWFITLDFSS